MNLLKNKLASRLMLLALLLVGAKTMSAESKLYIDPVAFDDYKVREIPVIFEHGGDMGAIQFDIILSKSLEFVDGGTDNPAIRRNADFLADGQKFGNRIYPTDANGRTAARVTIRTERKQAFPANKGTVAYLRVKAKDNSLDKTVEQNPEFVISLTNAKATNYDGTASEIIPAKAFDVSQISEISMGLTRGDFAINPAGEKRVSLNLTNTIIVSALQFDVTLPEGFSIKEGSYQLGQRASNGADYSDFLQKDGKTTRVVIYDMDDNKALGETKSGDFISFAIVAPAEFPESVELKFSNIIVSNQDGNDFMGPDFTVKVSNGGNIKATADAKVAELEKALTDAIAKIAETCPDVKDKFPGTEISDEIGKLKTAIETAYNDYTLAAKYEEVMAPATAISESIAKLITDAETAEKAFKAEAANTKALAEVKTLQDALAAALAEIAKDCKDVKDDFKGEAITAKIADLTKAIAAANEAGTLVEKYDETMAPAAGIKTEIEKLIADAKAAQQKFEADADAALKAKQAHEKATAEVKALQDALTAALAEIAKDCKDVKDDFTGEEISAKIDELAKAVEAANEAGTLVEKYDETMAPVNPIKADIANLVADAKAAQQKEVERKARNKEAYDKHLAELDKIAQELEDAAAEVKEAHPSWPYFITEKAKVSSMIKEARREAKEAYADVAEEGEYAYVLDSDSLREAILSFKTIADQTGIEDILVDQDMSKVKIYTIDGVRHDKPVKGALNIIVKADGSAVKVYVR